MPQAGTDEFDLILAEHGASVWRLIVRILGDDGHDAADCFQQAFVGLASRYKRLNDVRDPAALLKRIAAARAIDMVRRRIRERGRTHHTNEALFASRKAYEPDAMAESGELLEDLRGALIQLPEQQATVFVLTEIDNVPREEAASALGVTVNHLGVLLHRARAALRERLASHRPIQESPS